MKQRTKAISEKRGKVLIKRVWLFVAKIKGNQTMKELNASSCKNNEEGD